MPLSPFSHWRHWRDARRCQHQLRALRLLVLDVDGVLTDGGLWTTESGEVVKRFDVRDGLGIRLLQQAGLE
ncbi:MAG: phosphatase, partial [Cyanobacteriota bacterium]